MNEQNHFELLQLQFAELTGRTPFCPEDQQIAEYFDSALAENERTKLERHLNDCRFCRARIGMLERLESNDTHKRVPEAVLATAKQMTHKNPARWNKMAPRWAAAAVLVMALLITVENNQRLVEPGVLIPTASLSEENSNQLRGVKRNAIRLEVLSPTQGANLKPGSLLQWVDIPGTLHYNIFVLSSTGDVLWTQRLGGTDWLLDGSLQLTSGNQYFFRVEALLPDGRSVSSRHVGFKVRG